MDGPHQRPLAQAVAVEFGVEFAGLLMKLNGEVILVQAAACTLGVENADHRVAVKQDFPEHERCKHGTCWPCQ